MIMILLIANSKCKSKADLHIYYTKVEKFFLY